MIYIMFLSNNPSPGDINSSNLPCYHKAKYIQRSISHESHLEKTDFGVVIK